MSTDSTTGEVTTEDVDVVAPPATRPRWYRRIRPGVVVLALLAYVPALTAAPGRMTADSKLYLYLDPQRLVSDAFHSFDPRQFAGWVPHQHIAYLWPSGPWFSIFDWLGVPDWVAHRLWLGTLMFMAGLGVRWAARLLGLSAEAALAAALVYQLCPYVLPYTSRTSVMLLPWAGLGWIVGLTMLAATRSVWRHAALAALVVLTVGAVNATALIMIVPAPALWLLHAATSGQISWTRAFATAARVSVLSIGVSLWWVAALVIQGRYGADVLAYSETLEAVSFTSISTEVLRGLGYWLFYVRDPYAATTTASLDYLVSGRVVATGMVVLLLCLVGLVVTRWAHRRYAVALVAVGVVLAVGVNPIDDQSPLMRILVGESREGLALALRSSTRAVPVSVFGLALGAGALVHALGTTRWRWRPSVPWGAAALPVVALVAIANLPALWTGAFIDPALERDQDPPDAWTSAARDLDAAPPGHRVLQLPGAEFGAFRWGYTVDQPLPGLTERPLVTRDLLPLGSPAAMDLLYAFDDRIQMGAAEARSLAPVARLFGADTIWLTNDQAFDRFRTPRPDLVARAVVGAPGTGEVRSYGPAVVNVPDIPMIDEQAWVHGPAAEPLPIVQLVAIDAPEGIIRVKDRQVVLAGSGDGVVDAAAAGVIDGVELIRYAAALTPEELAGAALDAEMVIVTDSNRARARLWRGSQDVVGFTEDGGPDPQVLRPNDGDERLPVFERTGPRHQTTATQVGPVRARASAYGEPLAYRPESRAAMAVDGELSTAWVVADRFVAEGEHLVLETDSGVDQLTLRQPDTPDGARRITEVSVRIDDADPFLVGLDERSLSGNGQPVDILATAGPTTVTITITDTDADPASPLREQAVGFASVDFGRAPTVEVVKLPTDAVSATGPETPMTYVLTRERVRPTDRWRSDPEPALMREFALPQARDVEVSVVVRLDQRASDQLLADLFGIDAATSSNRLHGVARAAASSAVDGDPSTSWTSAFGAGRGSVLRFPLDPGIPIDRVVIRQPVDELHSTITEMRLAVGSTPAATFAVPPPDSTGLSTLELPGGLGDELVIEITGVDERITTDRRYAEPVVLPVALTELDAPGLVRIEPPTQLDTGCRDDLLALDGAAIALRIVADVDALLDGLAITAQRCGADGPIPLPAGARLLRSAAGSDTGLQIDQVVLRSVTAPEVGDLAAEAEAETARPSVAVRSSDRTSRSVDVSGCDEGCWLVLGEGYSEGWTASVAGVDLGHPEMVDGGFNGWRLPPLSATGRVELRWSPQPILLGALVASALSTIICVGLVVADRRRRPARPAGPPALAAGWTEHWGGESRRQVAAVTAAWVVMVALVVQPWWALVALAIGALAVAVRSSRVIGMAALAVAVWTSSAVVLRVVTDRPFPNAGWVLSFTDLHRPGVFLVTALLASALVPDRPQHQCPTAATPSV
jgi:arabinofuranan 3-O-arabinosyltransferase